MGIRRIFGDFKLNQYTVASGQAVEAMDMVSYAGATVQRATDTAWASAVATPTAPTVADSTVALSAGGLTNGVTGVKISYQFPWGEGTLSAAATATPTAHAALLVTGASLTPPAPALWTNIYTETSAGSGVYAFWGKSTGEGKLVTSYGVGPAPYAGNTGGVALAATALVLTQYNFALNFLGIANQRMPTSGPPAIFGTPTRPFGNSLDNSIMVCRGGVFEFPIASATLAEGTYLGPAKDTGNDLLNQQVVAVSSPQLAIAKVYRGITSNTLVWGEIMSRFQTPFPTPAGQW